MENETAAPAVEDRIVCQIDGQLCHVIQSHINKHHADTWTIERYREEFPEAPLMSQKALDILARRQADAKLEEERRAAVETAAPASTATTLTTRLAIFHELFEMGNAKGARNAQGHPINVKVMEGHDDQALLYLPDVDRQHVFDIDLTKKIIAAMQMGLPIYLWGMHGTGKTSSLEQVAARTRRPFMRVQHSLNMQESDVLGQWTVKDGATIFQLGPLPMAMINGWVYCADEYDTAMPSVTTIYQPVLEGKPLIIKDAPPHFRRIVPHPEFRFCATGNTNGSGDETGLYQGTLVQNAANYSRFAVTVEVGYMPADLEIDVVISKSGIGRKNAEKLVRFATDVREQFRAGKIAMTISPREIISAAKLGIAFTEDWKIGIELAFANRLPRVDRQTVDSYLQRLVAK